uniref:Polycystin 1 like 2 (gene/pseudogene) n=1 Tax=Prolemur simus TaxID=1328070 RepID=A0A8C8YVC3_PROSS
MGDDSPGAMFSWYLDSTPTEKAEPLPEACGLSGFWPRSLTRLQSNTSALRLRSPLLRPWGEVVRIRATGSCLHCGPEPVLPSVYLPLGKENNDFVLTVVISVTNHAGDRQQTHAAVKVRLRDTRVVDGAFQAAVSEKIATTLQGEHGTERLLQLAKSVSSALNAEHQSQGSGPQLRTDVRRKVQRVTPICWGPRVCVQPFGLGGGVQGSEEKPVVPPKWLTSPPSQSVSDTK